MTDSKNIYAQIDLKSENIIIKEILHLFLQDQNNLNYDKLANILIKSLNSNGFTIHKKDSFIRLLIRIISF